MEEKYTPITKDKLLDNIKRHNELYRKGTPEISDAEYDAEVEQLKELDPENEWFKHIEPVSISSGRKVSLPVPMKSLNKAKSLSEVIKWCKSLGLNNKTEIVCMPKFDGLSLLVNELTGMAYSRGGAENEGQDCSKHVLAANIKKDNRYSFTFGEFVISNKNWDDFFKDKLSPSTGEKFKSPRNTAAGMLNADEPNSLIQYASLFRYGISQSDLVSYTTYEQVIEEICDTYHQQSLFNKYKIEDLTEELLKDMFSIWSNDYPIDGIVIYINNLAIWDRVGRHEATGNPLYAIAYKHPDFTSAFHTTVRSISWKVSKSGALKPVVNIETVDTGDCNMENPTGYNAKWIYAHQIAKGAKVLVTRSGGVIPKILKTLEPADHEENDKLWEDMCCCPHCGSPTQWNESQVELCCTNPECPGIKLAKIVFFYNTLGAENMGEETISKIFDAGFQSIPSILNISFQDLMNIEGFGETTANIILQNNRKIMSGVELPILMQASDCFKGIGEIKARKLLENMSKSELHYFCNGEYLCEAPDINSPSFKEMSVTTQSLHLGYLPFIHFLNSSGIPVALPKFSVETSGKCSGFSVCVSGFRDSAFESSVINTGGKIVSGVSKKTTHLVVKDKDATSTKISKAESLNITIMTIDEFIELYLS